jgi:hypothetical protein
MSSMAVFLCTVKLCRGLTESFNEYSWLALPWLPFPSQNHRPLCVVVHSILSQPSRCRAKVKQWPKDGRSAEMTRSFRIHVA